MRSISSSRVAYLRLPGGPRAGQKSCCGGDRGNGFCDSPKDGRDCHSAPEIPPNRFIGTSRQGSRPSQIGCLAPCSSSDAARLSRERRKAQRPPCEAKYRRPVAGRDGDSAQRGKSAQLVGQVSEEEKRVTENGRSAAIAHELLDQPFIASLHLVTNAPSFGGHPRGIESPAVLHFRRGGDRAKNLHQNSWWGAEAAPRDAT